MMEQPILNPPNPYVGTLRVFPGTLVKVSGQARPNATRFAINFQTGPSLNPRDDLALHLSPCFTPPRIVRNSLQHGAWGLEESWSNGSILTPHQPFEIMVLVEADQFKIALNGAHYCEFKHRIPYHEISHLTIDGDVNIDRISITSSELSYHSQPSAPPSRPVPPYPSASGPGAMPMPGMYPTLSPSSNYPPPSMAQGPMPTPATYLSGYPQSGGPYPPQSGAGPTPTGAGYGHGPVPTSAGYHQPGGYPGAGAGPMPTGASYLGGYPHQAPHQPGHSSSSSPFGNLPIGGKALGTIAGLGLGAAAGAAVLSAAKKVMKPKKMFKHKGWGKSSSSSSSSGSSRSSFSSNSS